jgi:hypothetical protein
MVIDTPALDLISRPECGRPAVILDRVQLPSTHGPVEHIKVRCVTGPWCASCTWVANMEMTMLRLAREEITAGAVATPIESMVSAARSVSGALLTDEPFLRLPIVMRMNQACRGSSSVCCAQRWKNASPETRKDRDLATDCFTLQSPEPEPWNQMSARLPPARQTTDA